MSGVDGLSGHFSGRQKCLLCYLTTIGLGLAAGATGCFVVRLAHNNHKPDATVANHGHVHHFGNVLASFLVPPIPLGGITRPSQGSKHENIKTHHASSVRGSVALGTNPNHRGSARFSQGHTLSSKIPLAAMKEVEEVVSDAPGVGLTSPRHMSRSVQGAHAPALRSMRRSVSPMMSFGEAPEPSEEVIAAVERAYAQGAVGLTAADLVARGGISLDQARAELTRLAAALAGNRDVSVMVSNEGDLVYTFPRKVRAELAARSSAARAREAWRKAKPALATGGRIAFGVASVVATVVVWASIAVLTSSSDDDDDDNRGGRSDDDTFRTAMYLDSLTDWYFWRPRYYYGWFEPPPKMSLFEAIFSFVFGDGNPNSALAAARTMALAEVVRANGGVVVAEQLAPFLDVPSTAKMLPSALENDTSFVDESWMLPAVQQLGGVPEVTSDGTIVYRFDDLQVSALMSEASLALVDPELANFDQLSIDQLEAVAKRRGIRITPYRDVGVQVRSWAEGQLQQQLAYSENLFPNGYLEEKPIAFSNAEPLQLFQAGGLGALFFGGTVLLGNLLRRLPPGTVLPGFLRAVSFSYPLLLVYSSTFVLAPVARAVRLRFVNKAIAERNQTRRSWREALRESRANKSLRKRLNKAKEFAGKVRRIGKKDIAFDSAKDISEQPDSFSPPSLDDWDRRLGDGGRRSETLEDDLGAGPI